MSSPEPSRGPSPLRVGGLALLGIGVVAAIVGIYTLVTGGNDGRTAAPTPTPTAAAPDISSPPATAPGGPAPGGPAPGGPAPGGPAPGGPAPGGPAPGGSVAVPSFGAAPTYGIAAPGTDGPGGAGSGGTGSGGTGSGSGTGGSGAVKMPVRVYNNSTISGLAARAADDFRAQGWPVDEVSNYPSGIIPTSTVYYRPGSGEKNSADAMGNGFGLRVEPRFDGLADASAGLIVIVTNDYRA